jgi:hypothetical protein
MVKRNRFFSPVRCRECSVSVRMVEQICPHCAAQAPVQFLGWLSYVILGLSLNTVLHFLAG